MSLKENDLWLNAAFDNFRQAIDEHDYALCSDIIYDTADAGFTYEARILEADLLEQPISQFQRKLTVNEPTTIDELLTHLEKTGKVQNIFFK